MLAEGSRNLDSNHQHHHYDLQSHHLYGKPSDGSSIPQELNMNNYCSAHTFFLCIVAALHYFECRRLTDKVANGAGEFSVAVLRSDDVLQPGATPGLVPHVPVVCDTAVSGCNALQENCAGFVQGVPGGIGSQDRLPSYGLC